MRFALHHVPGAPARSFWIAAVGIFLLIAVSVIGLNLVADPLDLRLAPHAAAVRKEIIKPKDNVLWAVGEIRKIPPAVLGEVTLVMVGDSRVETLVLWRQNRRVVKIGGDYLLNLAVGGSSFEENMEMLAAALPHLPKLRGVLIGAPVERFGIRTVASRVPGANRILDSPLQYLLGLRTLGWSLEVLRRPISAGERRAADADAAPFRLSDMPDLSPEIFDPRKKEAASAEETTPVRSRGSGIELYRNAFASVDFDLIQRRIDETIRPLVQPLTRRGIKVVFFLPPLRPKVRLLAGPGIDDVQRRYVGMLGELGVVEDFTVGSKNGLTPRFRDLSHVFPTTAQAILGDIYVRNFAEGKSVAAPPR